MNPAEPDPHLSAVPMSMKSREQILADIRKTLPQSTARPVTDGDQPPWQTFDDVCRRFRETLSAVGGECLEVADAEMANEALSKIAPFQAAEKVVSLVPGIGRSSFDVDEVSDPHDLEDVDFAILPGQFAVAENAAVWVTDEEVRHRVLFFIPQHIALVVPRGELVHNMHEAYERITFAQHPQFSAFISGPSKTADIEQSLVIGAHGARTLTVFLIG